MRQGTQQPQGDDSTEAAPVSVFARATNERCNADYDSAAGQRTRERMDEHIRLYGPNA